MDTFRRLSYFKGFIVFLGIVFAFTLISRIYTGNNQMLLYVKNLASSLHQPAEELKNSQTRNPDLVKLMEKDPTKDHINLPSPEELKTKTDNELEDLYHGFMNKVQVKCNKIVRVGSPGDGGWNICLDDRYYPMKPCLVYSFGIGGDSSFDVEMKKIFGCEVHSFDPFVQKSNVPNVRLINFHPIGLGGKTYVVNGRKFMTLLDIRKHLNHSKRDICILKMDIEDSEWSSLTKAVSDGELDHVKQLSVEFHSVKKGTDFFRNALIVIKKLMDFNFRVYLTERNNACKYVNSRNTPLTTCYNIYLIKVD